MESRQRPRSLEEGARTKTDERRRRKHFIQGGSEAHVPVQEPQLLEGSGLDQQVEGKDLGWIIARLAGCAVLERCCHGRVLTLHSLLKKANLFHSFRFTGITFAKLDLKIIFAYFTQ